jgi:hypothetical protein
MSASQSAYRYQGSFIGCFCQYSCEQNICLTAGEYWEDYWRGRFKGDVEWLILGASFSGVSIVDEVLYLLQVCHLHSQQIGTSFITVVRQHNTAGSVWYSCRYSCTSIHELLAKWRSDFVPVLWFSTSCSSNFSNCWGTRTWTSALLLRTLEAGSDDASHFLLPGITCTNTVFSSWAAGSWQRSTTSATKH